ncbi:MAG TPA: LysR family transcriptional regulator [Verrucomicrobiae bacterium]|nr:LysR family transcriptional regulator [Verrucomicrobiae bacterium]
MELRHLRYFVAVAEQENVSRAALKLHVSQPGISRQIHDLEGEIGFPLFERTAKSLKLTAAGKVFLAEAKSVLKCTDDAVKKAKAVAAGATGELHIGYSPTPTTRILPPTLRAFQLAMPNVRVKLHDLANQENITRLREGKLQLAFLVRPPDFKSTFRGLRFEALSCDAVCLVVAPNHPLARRKIVSLAEAAREPFVSYSRKDYPDYHEWFSNVFSGVKFKPRIVEEHDGISSLFPAIEAGAGVALAGESFKCIAGNRLKLLRLTPEPEPVAMGIAALKGKLSAAAEKFWECAKIAADGAK